MYVYALKQSIKETVTSQPWTLPRPQKPLRSSSIRQEPLRFSRVCNAMRCRRTNMVLWHFCTYQSTCWYMLSCVKNICLTRSTRECSSPLAKKTVGNKLCLIESIFKTNITVDRKWLPFTFVVSTLFIVNVCTRVSKAAHYKVMIVCLLFVFGTVLIGCHTLSVQFSYCCW